MQTAKALFTSTHTHPYIQIHKIYIYFILAFSFVPVFFVLGLLLFFYCIAAHTIVSIKIAGYKCCAHMLSSTVFSLSHRCMFSLFLSAACHFASFYFVMYVYRLRIKRMVSAVVWMSVSTFCMQFELCAPECFAFFSFFPSLFLCVNQFFYYDIVFVCGCEPEAPSSAYIQVRAHRETIDVWSVADNMKLNFVAFDGVFCRFVCSCIRNRTHIRCIGKKL